MRQLRWSFVFVALLAHTVHAQRVLLELRPRMGDTLRMRLDQTTEMSGARRGTPTKQVVTTLRMFSRAIVQSASSSSAMILAVTDSAAVTTNDDRAQPLAAETQRQLAGRQMRLRLAPDGTVSVADDQQGSVPRAVNDLVAVMPASFPRASVAVGDTWLREMPIPPSASMGVPLGGIVKAAFKLDSLSDNGDMAYLTMRGTMHQMTDATVLSDPSALTGAVTGSMVVDRRRGWLSESRFLVEMRATVAPLGVAKAVPMQFRLKITQHMRTLDKRP